MRTRRPPRDKRVRQRLLVALLVCALALLAAAAPGVALGVSGLADEQRQAEHAELTVRAISLAHALADERDDMAVFVAGGRSTAHGAGVTEADRSRVDRQVQDVFAGTTPEVRRLLGTLSQVRQDSLTGDGTAQAVLTSYTELIDALNRTGGPVVPPLARAVEQASAQRALLVSALTATASQRPLITAAQTSSVREQAALADFRASASAAAREQYDQTVTGADAAEAERYVKQLTGQPQPAPADRALGAARVKAALTARIGLMRNVESSLATAESARIAAQRDDDVTALELRAALAGVCLLLTIGILVSTARSITRPLAALHRFARGGADEAKVIGHDEFAVVARKVNELAREAQSLRTRGLELGAGHTRLQVAHDALAAERDRLLAERDRLLGERAALLAQKDALAAAKDELIGQLGSRGAADGTYTSLSLRTLGLVERQLALLEGLEDREHDPERLETLFKLDHLATRMRRNSENLLVLSGTEHTHGGTAKPVPLVDVARAAISEIERYERVRIQLLPPGPRLAGHAADDTSHLIAELLDNATAFSPPHAEVQLSGWMLENGEVMLSIEDQGIGMPADRLAELNALLTADDLRAPADATGMGLYVVARLAARHGVRVQVREQKQGGVAAVVILPRALLVVARPDETPGGVTSGASSATAGRELPVESELPVELEPELPREPELAVEPEEHARLDESPAEGGDARPQARAGEAGRIPAQASAEAAAQATAQAAPQTPAQASEPEPEPEPEPGFTAKGLPQRVPLSTGLTGEPAVRDRERTGPVDAAALRRKFGGLQQGLREGRHDVQREIRGGAQATAAEDAVHEPGEAAAAETVEEASR